MPSHFKVKEYCPNVFRNLRERFGVDEQEYLVCLYKRSTFPCGICASLFVFFYLSLGLFYLYMLYRYLNIEFAYLTRPDMGASNIYTTTATTTITNTIDITGMGDTECKYTISISITSIDTRLTSSQSLHIPTHTIDALH